MLNRSKKVDFKTINFQEVAIRIRNFFYTNTIQTKNMLLNKLSTSIITVSHETLRTHVHLWQIMMIMYVTHPLNVLCFVDKNMRNKQAFFSYYALKDTVL